MGKQKHKNKFYRSKHKKIFDSSLHRQDKKRILSALASLDVQEIEEIDVDAVLPTEVIVEQDESAI